MRRVEFWSQNIRMFGRALVSLRVLSVALIATLVFVALLQNVPRPSQEDERIPPAKIDTSILYTFNVEGELHETGSMDDTRSPYWWLDSGGKLVIKDSVGMTLQGSLSKDDPWYKEYAKTNPEDTDGGKHPQNLFRLVSRSQWDNARVEASFWVQRDNLSKSANRNESNGLFLMSRYQDDGQTLYYAGVRVDGTAVIKKKYKGTYYTMAQKKIFSGTYHIENMPDLLPSDGWIRLRAETTTSHDESVSVSLYMQEEGSKEWKRLVSAKDSGQYDESPPVRGESPVGVRTDFLDVKFDDILMEKL